MLEKKYNHLDVEENKYSNWLKKGYFEAGDLSKEPFCIVIPPPNVTGKLHLGHAWDTTLQDIIIRYKRMDGFDALWIPGMDHAGIATQARVDAQLRNEGIDPRSMKREDWMKEAWKWKEIYATDIREQWGKLGHSLDYTKERFTLDEGLSDAVQHVFISLYNKGYIYRGERIINWDPLAMTALSNEEVIHKEIAGALYHIKYWLEDKSDYLVVATSRPETIFGDVALAVNPKDNRYKNLVGKKVILPVVNKLIPIIADDYVEMEYGTGVVKITPAHDPNDFEVGNRHNLERINCINKNGTMNDHALKYSGLDRFECRKELIADLTKDDLLVEIENIKHSVGHSERTGVIIESYLSKQWFVKMDGLAHKVLENQKTENKVNFVPERFEKILNHWMENVHDWCISRQLWWGHSIPAWYKDDEVYVGEEKPEGEGWLQDPDVLDTWFSSALWPFTTLDWPHNLDDRYFPNDVLVTGYDIIFFWVCRMIFQSLEFTNKRPFKNVLIHGLIRASDGQKMSKSLDNGVDPMDVIEEYGADSLRFFLTTNTAPGQDLRYDEEKIKSTWNFINKLWNASRYVMMSLEEFENEKIDVNKLSNSDKWILSKQNEVIQVVRRHMESYDFHVVGQELYSFIWNDFCDWYIELSKTNMNNQVKLVLLEVLTNILKMLHPFMPYVTEEIYLKLPNCDESIMISNYPQYKKEYEFENEVHYINTIIDMITKIRVIKNENLIGRDFLLVNKLTIENKSLIEDNKNIFEKLLKCIISDDVTDEMTIIELNLPQGLLEIAYIGKEEVIDLDLLNEERTKIINSINRREKLLSNEGYVKKAPEKIINSEKEKLTEEKQNLIVLNEKINSAK